MKDYYYILGISKDANIEEIKKAFKKLSLKFHPDKNPGDTYFENRFKEILEAYEILSNERSRANYDSSIYDKSSESAKQSSNSFIILWKSNVIKRYLKFKLIFIIGIITPIIFYLIYLFYMFLINLQNERNLANLMQEFSGVWMLDHIKYKGYNHWGNTICYPQTIEFDKNGMFKRTDLRLNNIIDSFTFKVNSRSISLFRKDNTEFLTNIQFERTFDTLIILGYENDDTIELKMSKRKLYPRSIKREKLNVDEFRGRMEISRRLIDDDSLYCEGIKGIVETSDSVVGIESEFYKNGKDISILLALNHISADHLVVPFANQILLASNKKFYAIEKSTFNYLGYPGIPAVFWMIGYTHPQAELLKFYTESKIRNDYDDAIILKDFSIEYDKYYQSKLASSSGMTYSEIAVNHIHYDLEIPNEAKESIYSELADKLEGHGKANVYYCWYLLNKDNKLERVENKKLLENIIYILEEIGGFREHKELLQIVKKDVLKI